MTAPGGRLEAWLAGLQGGLDGYPSARAKGSLVRTVLAGQPRRALEERLPAPVRRLVAEPPVDSEWIPEAHLAAMIHAITDLRGWDEAEVVRWVVEGNRALFSSPAYRILMLVVSPSAMLKHAGMRWSNWHRGTTLEFLGFADDGAGLALTFPAGLFDGLMLRYYAAAFSTALELARAAGSSVEVVEHRPGFARYRARW
jgi:hypothetical protein